MDALTTVERYTPDQNAWKEMAPLRIPRKNASAVVINEEIYVIG